MSKADSAVACFGSFNCSQAVFSTYCEDLGLEREKALKIACGFGGGMGHLGLTCGAVTGAFMLIGLKYGKYLPDDVAAKERTYALVKEFSERFKSLHGSICCNELLGCDMNTPEGEKYARDNGLWRSLCPQYVSDAATIVEDLLELK
jgi:C_GCAxxG_C_C family probable redox protein